MIGNLIREAVSEQKNTIPTGSINVGKKFIVPLKRLLKDSNEKDVLSEVGCNFQFQRQEILIL